MSTEVIASLAGPVGTWDIDYDSLARELIDKQGYVAIATHGQYPIYRLGDTVEYLFSFRSRVRWVVVGFLNKAIYLKQQELIYGLHPEWSDRVFTIQRGIDAKAVYYELIPEQKVESHGWVMLVG